MQCSTYNGQRLPAQIQHELLITLCAYKVRRSVLYKSLFTIQDGRNDNNEKRTKKHSQQTITHYDSDITCPEISSDDEQAGHSANQSKTLPGIEQQPVYH